MKNRFIKGRNVTPRTPTAEEVISAVNGLAKATGLKLLDFKKYDYSATIVLPEEVNELHYDFLQVKDEQSYLHEVHPAKVILKKIYDILILAEKENNDGVAETIKRVEVRNKNDDKITKAVKKLEDDFLKALVKLEFEMENLECTVTVDRLLGEVPDYASIHTGVLKLRDEAKETA